MTALPTPAKSRAGFGILLMGAIGLLTGCASNPSRAVMAPAPEGPSRWYSEAYEVSCDEIGVEGVQLLEVTTIGDDEDAAMWEGRRAAVKALVFKGVRSTTCQVPELVPSTDMTDEADQVMTELFQNGGPYLQFIVGAGDEVLRASRLPGGQFRITTAVNVNRTSLADYLAERGVTVRLGDIFRRGRE